MCELMEQYVQEEREEGKAEMIQEMLRDDMSIDKIAQYANIDRK